MKRQRGFIDGSALASAMIGSLIVLCVVCAVGGWALIEGAIWLFHHLSIGLK